jgi:hypothetical protein
VLTQIVVSNDGPESIQLAANSSGLHRLASAIRDGNGCAGLSTDEGEPIRLMVSRVSHRKRLTFSYSWADRQLAVEGPQECAELLAWNIDDLADTPPPYHWHLEWFDEHLFLERGSTPCVFVLNA